MLAAVSRHVMGGTASFAPSASVSSTAIGCHDLHGNDYRIDDGGALMVLGAGDVQERQMALPELAHHETLVGLAADNSGFLWAATARSLSRLNPRQKGANGADDPTSWTDWTAGEAPLPAGTIASIVATVTDSTALIVLQMADGSSYRVDFADSATDELTITAGGEVEDETWEVSAALFSAGHYYACPIIR